MLQGIRCFFAVATVVGVFSLAGCGDEGEQTTTEASNPPANGASGQGGPTTKPVDPGDPPPEPPAPPLGEKQCDTPDPMVCQVAGQAFGKEAIFATAFGSKENLAISYSFESPADKAAIEDSMVQAYEWTFDAFDTFKYVEIAAFKPGDKPGVDFPLYDTSIGQNEVVASQDPREYWRVESIAPSLK